MTTKEKIDEVDQHYWEGLITLETRDFLVKHIPYLRAPTKEEMLAFLEKAEQIQAGSV